MGGGRDDLFSVASTRDLSLGSSVARSTLSASSSSSYGARDRVVHCEVEEIASIRWLPSPLRWRSPSPKRARVVDKSRSSYGSAAEAPLPIDCTRLLPSDYKEIISRAVSPVEYSSTEQLYQLLCEPILIDEGVKMIWLEKPTGKKCYMLSARAIGLWGIDARYWKWISVPDARFPEVAELRDVWWLEMKASISTRELSPGTRYGAYLVMRHSGSDTSGLESPLQETFISVGGVHSLTREVRFLGRQGVISYQRGVLLGKPPDGGEEVCVPRARDDGWMELEMGVFFIEAGKEELVDVRLKGRRMQHWGFRLIVHGVEVRPMP